jgi:hypothetical protein
MADKLRGLADEIFGVDLRALGALRISLGGLTLVDLALRSEDFCSFCTDAGVFPRAIAKAMAPEGTASLYFLSGAASPACVLLAIHALAALALLLGLQTRLATVLTWLLTVSLQNRNPLVLQGADDLLRLLLFWSMFLPLGARWSLDARRIKDPTPPRVVSVATAALLVQVAVLYAATSLEKTGREWRDGSAVWVVLSHDHFGRPWAQAAFLSHPDLLRALCWTVLTVERLAPILLLAPILTRSARLVALGALVVLQAAFGATLYLGHFPWVSTVALLPFVPASAWDVLERRLSAVATPRPSIPARVSVSMRRRWRPSRVAGTLLAGAALAYMLAWTAAGLAHGFKSPLGRASWVGALLGLDATWAMFAPEPARDSGWFVIPGRLADGTTIDLFPALARFDVERPVTYDKPPRVFDAFPGPRWLDYLMDLTEENRGDLWAALSDWTCHGWNEAHRPARRLEQLEITFVLEEVTSPGAARPRSRRVYFRGECPESLGP